MNVSANGSKEVNPTILHIFFFFVAKQRLFCGPRKQSQSY